MLFAGEHVWSSGSGVRGLGERRREGGREGGGVCSAVREVWILITRTSMVLWRQAEMDGV